MSKIETYIGTPRDILTVLQLHSGVDDIKIELHVISEIREDEWLVCFTYDPDEIPDFLKGLDSL